MRISSVCRQLANLNEGIKWLVTAPLAANLNTLFMWSSCEQYRCSIAQQMLIPDPYHVSLVRWKHGTQISPVSEYWTQRCTLIQSYSGL